MRAKAILESRGAPFRNSSEKAYAMNVLEPLRLSGAILHWGYEQVRFNLAPGTNYTPDFFVIWEDGQVEFVEYKGFRRPTGIVKIKVAADRFPWFRWKMVEKLTKKKGGGYKETIYG